MHRILDMGSNFEGKSYRDGSELTKKQSHSSGNDDGLKHFETIRTFKIQAISNEFEMPLIAHI